MKKIIFVLFCVFLTETIKAQVPYQQSKKYVEKTLLGKWELDKEKLLRVTLEDFEAQGKPKTEEEVKPFVDKIEAFMEFKKGRVLVQKIENNPEETLKWNYDEVSSNILMVLPNGKKDMIIITKLTKLVFVFKTSEGEVYFRKVKK